MANGFLPVTERIELVKVFHQPLPLKAIFRIARGAKTQADVVTVLLSDGLNYGWSEAVPYSRYNESVSSVILQIEQLANYQSTDFVNHVMSMPAGAARNALDCALWDLKAKQQNKTVAELLQKNTTPCVCAQTLSIDTPQAMADAVKALNNPPLVKVKLDNQDILKKMAAISNAAPHSQFIVDANEGWSFQDLVSCCEQLKQLNVVLIEQPLPVGEDHNLLNFDSPIPLCADESCHTRADLPYLKGRYQVINIKLDKTGGLTEANNLAKEAKQHGFELMLGCMVGSSLAMAPLSLLSGEAKYVDLDGPLLIKTDRAGGFEFNAGIMQPLNLQLWGGKNNKTLDSILSQMK
ncbi:dipeptide epimerase [Pseudoalteromonas sp. KG3]|uniref:N-acetyl-D-Glu racemase DgcA n=1 Tax=Pseudoalteromonas TaxID=53246 RepID=UPI0026589A9D|nr:N-acetyl-D-Glu racemase DgcA [Pseudoalteromonas sp. KG3]WKD25498.1 dipeptide epimerase [Pseudoalteromonas sp. KG3]